jgi:hypothetical protein
MNTLVSLPIAAAVPVQISCPLTTGDQQEIGDVSFPDLVAKFVQIRERWSTQIESDKAYSKKIDRLFFEATGVPMDEYRVLDWQSERSRQLQEVSNRIYKENPDENDQFDESGISTAWLSINEELDAVALAMLNRPPQSTSDLAWQTEALLLAENELREGSHAEHPMLPKLFENIRSLSGPLSIPYVKLAPAEIADPIFATIDAHRKAVAEYRGCTDDHSRLEAELPEDRRQSSITAWEDKIVETDDPRWIAAERGAREMSGLQDDAAYRLLKVSPTTLKGATALLKYYAEADVDGYLFPEKADANEQRRFGPSFAQGLASHVSNALATVRT